MMPDVDALHVEEDIFRNVSSVIRDAFQVAHHRQKIYALGNMLRLALHEAGELVVKGSPQVVHRVVGRKDASG
jgi:hypothetical protein